MWDWLTLAALWRCLLYICIFKSSVKALKLTKNVTRMWRNNCYDKKDFVVQKRYQLKLNWSRAVLSCNTNQHHKMVPWVNVPELKCKNLLRKLGVWIKKKGWNNSATSDKPDLFLLGFHLTPSVNAAPLKPVFTSLRAVVWCLNSTVFLSKL